MVILVIFVDVDMRCVTSRSLVVSFDIHGIAGGARARAFARSRPNEGGSE